MPSAVYPNPQVAPLNVAAGATSALTPIITELIGVDPETSLNAMFIRVVKLGAGCAASGPPHPTIRLKADTGDPVAVPIYPTAAPIRNQPGMGGSEVANATLQVEANDVYRIRVFIDTAGSNWQIQFVNNGASAHGFTWVVADSDGATLQPWIDMAETTDFGSSMLTTQVRTLSVEVRNRGTGPFTISDAPGPLAPGSPFALTTVPGPINPNGCGNIQITYTAPATPGASSAAYTATTSPTDTTAQLAAGHNRRVTVSATARKLEVVLLLDTSGSMNTKPDGLPAVAETDKRWSKARTAVGEFLDVLAFFGGGMGRMALSRFPSTDPCPSSADFLAPTDISSGAIMTAKGALAITPVGWTPMGHGIGRAMGTTAGSFGHFEGGTAVALNLRWLVILSDGDHNCSPPEPSFFFGTGATSFQAKNVRVITVQYGDPGSSTFAPGSAQLTAITGAAPGNMAIDAGADDAGSGLKKAFRGAITAGLSLDPTMDPVEVLTSTRREFRRSILITKYESKAAFIVDWSTFDADRVQVELLTPTCELVTPAVAQADPSIDYVSDARYAIYGFRDEYLRNAGSPDKPRYGEWTLIVSADGLEGTDRERIEYEVIFDSRLKMALSLDRARYFAGDPIVLKAELTLDGLPVTGAAVSCRAGAPGLFADNWLAAFKVSAAELDAARALLGPDDTTARAAKIKALRDRGEIFDPVPGVVTLALSDPEDDGTYTATFTQTATPGTIDFYVTAVGSTAEGVPFRREKRVHAVVGVRPDPVFTIWHVDAHRVVLDGHTSLVGQVLVFPRDRYGNVYLVEPDLTASLQVSIRGGDFTGPLVGHLDGSYSRPLQFDANAAPVLSLQVADLGVVADRPVVSPARLTFVDTVLDVTIGGEASPGANTHPDPQEILGDVLTKDPNRFVSLGAFGTVTVGVKGRVVVPEGDDDVTVFVRPDEELRPYRVEASTGGRTPRWVLLGESPGVTQSFGLSAAGITAAPAIRITDTSGRTRTNDLQPSETPGVSVRAVGFRATGHPPTPPKRSWWECLLDWIRKLLRRLGLGQG